MIYLKIYVKILSIFLSAVLIINIIIIPAVAKNDEINEYNPVIKEGGILNSQDSLIIQCHVLRISVLPNELIPTIDANSDGVFDSADLLILQMLILQS